MTWSHRFKDFDVEEGSLSTCPDSFSTWLNYGLGGRVWIHGIVSRRSFTSVLEEGGAVMVFQTNRREGELCHRRALRGAVTVLLHCRGHIGQGERQVVHPFGMCQMRRTAMPWYAVAQMLVCLTVPWASSMVLELSTIVGDYYLLTTPSMKALAMVAAETSLFWSATGQRVNLSRLVWTTQAGSCSYQEERRKSNINCVGKSRIISAQFILSWMFALRISKGCGWWGQKQFAIDHEEFR